MTPNRPYLLRAFYQWIVDNELTPYIVVDATQDGVEVPQEHVRDGQIVLNIAPGACNNLSLDNHYVSFEARFGGVARRLMMPVNAIMAIYARENGAGTIFADEEEPDETPPPSPKPKGKPSLKIVK
ncbi:ClpXP protease specificity-enhancing factor [Bowmanella sp. JS7-9]|uniref:ClpXP protease specificity-enhancing factor n=1 Tax=Pseudobowmanella zhangzhouensis TaxID=1537679 RepID=A0ABW1XP99_9ALTE|nr:ClpXP protease specificity-enhancing factor [Bowmanella sp. JS7-9]TBX21856.1 hypothetical protein TK45_10135 [Bowmanella sp. JS7-9]